MVVEASPSPPFIVAQAKLLLELAIIPLDAPAELGRGHEIAPRRVRRKRGQPVFERLGIAFGPLDQQPFLGARPGEIVIPRSGSDAQGSEARGEIDVRSFAPCDAVPGLGRQVLRQRLGGK